MSDPVAAARATMAAEIAGLQALDGWIGGAGAGPFAATVERLFGQAGRLVVSGVGKSGHVARKIAATLASTGTPAMFVHPTEASHGDLGMIGRDDAVMALSKSGEATELADLIHYTRRFDVPLISMTCREASTLTKAATIALTLPDMPEAAGDTNAPTTSTTMMMAMGDAIAVALIRRRGFTPDDFRVFHPGGKLGAQLKKVSDLMHVGAELPLVRHDAPMREVLLTMTERRFGCAAVIDAAGDLVGLVTDGDLRRHMGPDLLSLPASDVMTRNPRVTGPDAFASEALRIMNELKITQLLAVANGKPVGILHVHDCLRAGVA
jgi:arabinose-5-phosphate isomerase